MSNKPGIDIEKLRQSQSTSNEIYKDNNFLNEEIRRKKQKREEAKQAIIKKINQDVTTVKQTPVKNQLDPIPAKPTQPLKQQETTIKAPANIKVIKSSVHSNKQKIKETQERISYTLQMDAITQDQVNAYKDRKARKSSLDVNDKFVNLTPKITYLYLTIVGILTILIIIAYIIYNNINN